MKYLDNLEALNSLLTCVNAADSRVFGRLECYSCKSTEADHRLKAYLKKRYQEDEVPVLGTSWEHSPTWNGLSTVNGKMLFLLLATLNAAYPDYDFSDVPPEAFHHLVHMNTAMNRINTTLASFLNADNINRIWEAIDQTIKLEDCHVYFFRPDADIEPETDGGGNLWSFYYFFYSKKERRIVFFACRAVSLMAPLEESI